MLGWCSHLKKKKRFKFKHLAFTLEIMIRRFNWQLSALMCMCMCSLMVIKIVQLVNKNVNNINKLLHTCRNNECCFAKFTGKKNHSLEYYNELHPNKMIIIIIKSFHVSKCRLINRNNKRFRCCSFYDLIDVIAYWCLCAHLRMNE